MKRRLRKGNADGKEKKGLAGCWGLLLVSILIFVWLDGEGAGPSWVWNMY